MIAGAAEVDLGRLAEQKGHSQAVKEFGRQMVADHGKANQPTCGVAHGCHALAGHRAGTYAMHVSGNWRVTFRFEHGDKGNIPDAGFEDYH
jgi:plasmid maintenance system killer protein